MTLAEILVLLSTGELEVTGRMVDASNATLYGRLSLDGMTAECVYKPVRGERPLWDFPDGTLAGREVATYLISEASGWSLVPPTVLRDGPFGPGMCQLWIDSTDTSKLIDVLPPKEVPADWLRVLSGHGPDGEEVTVAHADDERLRPLSVLDVVVNNTDRKGGHLLLGGDDRLYGIDHGICWHVENKLRTVLWGWAGKPLGDEMIEVLERLDQDLDGELGAMLIDHIQPAEVVAARRRLRRLVRTGVHPKPTDEWRTIPWPPF